ncbi:pseudouridylate synthase RPUSD2 isoform X2 [Rhineura floridana]|uniref:pseudouridylate synthase RPUSD2 isoform X2 n=1 Tax=Rhineura floridana TaxID=261503 RepID=UPI002AC89470|nr:pseudouridylate synthase RPUSD2 isoform X2 [Rhineura floridana]
MRLFLKISEWWWCFSLFVEPGAYRESVATAASILASKIMEEKPDLEPSEKESSPPPVKRRRLWTRQVKPPEESEKRYVPPPKRRNPGVSFSETHFAETSYYFEGGLRKVRPYYFDFQTYCKGRWNNDFLQNTIHRHEPPVTAQAIEFLEENNEVVVVDKPSSLPVHPCGRFRHNTVIFILGKEHNLKELHTIHRLDRLTSGVLMFAKSAEVSKKIDEQVRLRQLEKEYVCRVFGEFPESEVTCEEPILVVSYKVGVCRVDPKGKPCKTVFRRLSYNGKTSVVKCFPYTGRTHQIRVHLQFLGHPIVNDPIYNTDAWGPEKGKDGNINKTDEELLQALLEEHLSKQSLGILDIAEEDLKPIVGDQLQKAVQLTSGTPKESKDEEKSGILVCSRSSVCQAELDQMDCGETCLNEHQDEKDPLCGECKIVRPDPLPKDLVMYLHALRYKGAGFEYCSKIPAWAQDDWEET